MSDFKFGDLAAVTKLNKRVVVMADQGDGSNIYISEGEGHRTYFMPSDELTLISHHYQWIELKDEWPEVEVSVLVFDARNPNIEPEIDYLSCHPSYGHIWENGNHPTHWMPIPTPPKEL